MESIIDSLSDVVFFIDILVCCRTIIVEEVKGRTIEISGWQLRIIVTRCIALALIVSSIVPRVTRWYHYSYVTLDGIRLDSKNFQLLHHSMPDTQVIFRRYLTGFLLLDVLGIGLPFTDYWVR